MPSTSLRKLACSAPPCSSSLPSEDTEARWVRHTLIYATRYWGLIAFAARLIASSFVQPDVLEAPFVVDAVRHVGPAFEPGLPARRSGRVVNHRPKRGFRQFAFGLPDDLFALFRVGLHRLLVDQLVEFRIAVAGVVARRTGIVVLVEHLVRVVDAA